MSQHSVYIGSISAGLKKHDLCCPNGGSGEVKHCHLRPPQAANCCRNSRLVVDEDYLKWVKNLRKLPCIAKSFMNISLLKPLNFSKMKSVFRFVKFKIMQIQNNAKICVHIFEFVATDSK